MVMIRVSVRVMVSVSFRLRFRLGLGLVLGLLLGIGLGLEKKDMYEFQEMLFCETLMCFSDDTLLLEICPSIFRYENSLPFLCRSFTL